LTSYFIPRPGPPTASATAVTITTQDTTAVLKSISGIDVAASLAYFAHRGGYCEVIMNVILDERGDGGEDEPDPVPPGKTLVPA
jgi:hypothetical protein